jgi:hypothetical protein
MIGLAVLGRESTSKPGVLAGEGYLRLATPDTGDWPSREVSVETCLASGLLAARGSAYTSRSFCCDFDRTMSLAMVYVWKKLNENANRKPWV